MVGSLQSWGWPSENLALVGYYECDVGSTFFVDGYGSHALVKGGPTSHQGNNCGTAHTHNRDTPLEHLSYHWAWAMQGKYPVQCAKAIAHSMGGLIIRYALSRVQAGDPDFPTSVCLSKIVTFGTPHAGSDDAAACPKMHHGNGRYVLPKQCAQIVPDSSFLASLPQNPQGSGGTEWTLIGSEDDETVSETSAIAMASSAYQVIYRDASHVHHANACNYMHARCTGAWSSHVVHESDDRTAWVDFFDPNAVHHSSANAPWPVRWADLILSGADPCQFAGGSNCGPSGSWQPPGTSATGVPTSTSGTHGATYGPTGGTTGTYGPTGGTTGTYGPTSATKGPTGTHGPTSGTGGSTSTGAPRAGVPGHLSEFGLSASCGGVLITWGPSSSDAPAATFYEVGMVFGGEFFSFATVAPGAPLSYFHEAEPGATHPVAVRAVNDAGAGPHLGGAGTVASPNCTTALMGTAGLTTDAASTPLATSSDSAEAPATAPPAGVWATICLLGLVAALVSRVRRKERA